MGRVKYPAFFIGGYMITEFQIFVEPITEDRPSLKAYKEYMCNKYRVKSVNDIKISIQEYADKMDIFEAGWQAKESQLLERLLNKNGGVI